MAADTVVVARAFKPGDVVRWGVGSRLDCVAIVGAFEAMGGSSYVPFAAWRVSDEWDEGPGEIHVDNVRSYKGNTDKIWADYCAWRLTTNL